MYGKAFESMYTGSMVGAGLNVWGVWNYVIPNTHFGVIEINPPLLAFILGCTTKEVEDALVKLCAPDPKSRSKVEDGRKMVKDGQFQYRVVNWEYYQALKGADDLRRYNREQQAKHRAKVKAMRSQPSPGEVAYEKALDRGDQAAADNLADPGFLREEPPELTEEMIRLKLNSRP